MQPVPSQRTRHTGRLPWFALVLFVTGCQTWEPFDSNQYLRDQYETRLAADTAEKLEVPFQLDENLRTVVTEQIRPSLDEERRIDQVQWFIHRRLGLDYQLSPTFNAVQTFHEGKGNCLSFANLFIGIARELRLNPFYVEVTDYNRWNYRDGMVVSQGHIVAGLRVDGLLRTYDFLPYRPKSYKEFNPIDDVTAAAHYYNNLAAEALMRGEEDRALEWVQVATRIAPDFTKAINNYGVTLSRLGKPEDALGAYRSGLEVEPDNVAILSNMVRAYQQLGRTEEAREILDRIEGFNHQNPFFFLYKGELALADNDPQEALELMKKAFRRETEIPEIHIGLAKTYLALGDLSKARHHLQRALRLDATHTEALKLARLLDERGQDG